MHQAHAQLNESWSNWAKCSLCGQDHEGLVRLALARAFWKFYKDHDSSTQSSTTLEIGVTRELSNALVKLNRHSDALPILKKLYMYQEVILMTDPQKTIRNDMLMDDAENHLCECFRGMSQLGEAVQFRRDLHEKYVGIFGAEAALTLNASLNIARELQRQDHSYVDAKAILRETLPVARRKLGPTHMVTLVTSMTLLSIVINPDLIGSVNTWDELLEAEQIAKDLIRDAPSAAEMLRGMLKLGQDMLANHPASPYRAVRTFEDSALHTNEDGDAALLARWKAEEEPAEEVD